jgi:hypothetical protein
VSDKNKDKEKIEERKPQVSSSKKRRIQKIIEKRKGLLKDLENK